MYCVIQYWRGIVNTIRGPFNTYDEALEYALKQKQNYPECVYDVRHLAK